MVSKLVSVGPATVGIKGKPEVNWHWSDFRAIPGFKRAEEFEVDVVDSASNKPKPIPGFRKDFVGYVNCREYATGYLSDQMVRNPLLGAKASNIAKVNCLVVRETPDGEVVEFRTIAVGHVGK